MFGRRKKTKPDFFETAAHRSDVLSIGNSDAGLDFLVGFFSTIRPRPGRRGRRGHRTAAENLRKMTARLQNNAFVRSNLQHAILSQLVHTDLSAALMESGIPLARGFWQELFGRLRHKLLPPYQGENDFLYVLNRVFFRNYDYVWVEDIPRADWVAFFETLGLSLHIDDRRILRQLTLALNTLSFQVAQLGLEKEVLNYLPEPYREENPFVLQNYAIRELEEVLSAPLKVPRDAGEPLHDPADRLKQVIGWCHECVEHVRENHGVQGASLHQTYMLLLLDNRLERISILLDLLDHERTRRTGGTSAATEHSEGRERGGASARSSDEVLPTFEIADRGAKLPGRLAGAIDAGRFVDFFRMLIRNENRKNSILEFASQSLWYLAYQIAEHKGAKGSKYITSTWAEYRGMLRSAMGGGAWICLVVLIKNLLIKVPMAIFWHGFVYSINYSLGFILIEETHTTLATKQPAFTASAVASSLDTRKNAHQPNLYNLAVTVAKVSRSQIASFAGNLLIVFPGAWFLAWGYEKVFGYKLVSGAPALKMLMDQHPWQSLSLLYACNTGVFLFFSGIIAGYVQNKIRYAHIARRLQTHPVLRLSMSAERLKRLSMWVEEHAGMLIGNISLGFFLGMAGFWGEIFGIQFEIRHITISAGNMSLAVYGLGFHNLNPWYLATVFGGVLGIGFLNFLVSFSLAFIVAARSRGVRLREYPEFLGILWRYFRSNPLDFIRPRRRQVAPGDG